MRIAGATVNQVEKAERRDGQEGELYFIGLEGFGLMYRGSTPPVVGDYVRAKTSTQWRKGKRPLFWLEYWEPAPIV